MAGREVFVAWAKLADADQVESSNKTSDVLLSAAGDWAVERGITNAALAGKNPAPPETRKAIKQRRSQADAALAQAFQRIEEADAFEASDGDVANTKAMLEQIIGVRRRVDTDLDKPLASRDSTLPEQWVSTMTSLIMASQNLRVAAQFQPDTIETNISQIQDAKGAIWTMSEYAGRERALLGRAISGGRPLDTEALQTLAAYRGRVEQSWLAVAPYLSRKDADSDVLAAAAAVNETFFGSFEATREAVYQAGISGSPFPSTPRSGLRRLPAQSTCCLPWRKRPERPGAN
ncbi:nitrate- and nitrite sensing domain-containing protein [Sinorhizobium fredii]|uniref:nitrate- and nitrite sensing domain-containing protein n=1 Tax=Rhizobium fredii TaxID=380 RepID=UPI00130E6C99|nr:nitrate- and nitrite sensing domain-containing protein [Sinorhizobium fredii]